MYSVGLDQHSWQSSMDILDPNGKRVKRVEVKGGREKLMAAVDELPRPFSICFEASCGYGHLFEQLSRRAERVSVAHPGHLRLIFRSKRKNDRVDASKLAKLLYLDAVPRVHVPNVEVRQWRASIEWRQRLLAQRVRVKNQVRSILRTYGLAAPKSLWSKKGLEWFRQQELGEFEQLRRDMLLDELSQVNEKIRRVERYLAKVSGRHPGLALLMTIPGVGIRTAEAFVAYVDDVRRFSRVSQVGTYFGLVPCQDASAEKNRLGHITKDGPRTVRKLLTEAAWQGIRRCPEMRMRFERIAGGKADRRKIALIATAHYLCRLMAAMLRTGECYDPCRAGAVLVAAEEEKDGGVAAGG